MDKMFAEGKPFFVGCNYWASHAGTFMWRNWSAETVERDFRILSENGVRVLRVFPLWKDFQPLTEHTQCNNRFKEFRMGEEPLPDTPEGRAGVDPVMLERFHAFARLAQKYNLRLIVGLITGWMSGRMHAPTAFERRNLLTDPEVIRWQVRFVRCFVRNLKDEPAITAWDWGNECNCLDRHTDPEMWVWGNLISSAIRAEDTSRQIVSGLHGSHVSFQADMGEVADVLCTHPYPAFTPHCRVDPLDSFRNAFHAAAETNFYSGVSGKPAFVEEIGSFSGTHSSDRMSAIYLSNSYWNSYAHGCFGALWWCANDQTELPQTPYDWVSMERELGLLRADGTPKPSLVAMHEFEKIAEKNILPPRRIDAICILSEGIDHWGVGFMSFLLAKQAGFDIALRHCEQPLEESGFYILPSITGHCVISKHRYAALLKKVEAGATLLVSSAGCGLQPMSPLGVEVETVYDASEPGRVVNPELGLDLTISRETHVRIGSTGADVLATDGEGAPAFTCAAYGKGKISFLNLPLETSLTDQPRAFAEGAQDYAAIYRIAAEKAGIRRIVTRSDAQVTLTEHPISSARIAVVAVNNTVKERPVKLAVASGWHVSGCVNGTFSDGVLTLKPKCGAILQVEK